MRTTPISKKERKILITIGWIIDGLQAILEATVAGFVVNEILDILIFCGFLIWMIIRRVITIGKVLKLLLIFGVEEIPIVDFFWFWRNFAKNTLYDGVPQEGESDMPPIIPPPIIGGDGKPTTQYNGPKPPVIAPPVIPRNTNLRPPPLNIGGARIPRK
jgi:hypothetical protein